MEWPVSTATTTALSPLSPATLRRHRTPPSHRRPPQLAKTPKSVLCKTNKTSRGLNRNDTYRIHHGFLSSEAPPSPSTITSVDSPELRSPVAGQDTRERGVCLLCAFP
ncbi:hypothetical protein HanIR_Chr06g0272691 [Helianthus annuus]|nr:hypothetical protein HanIR_Chr06g0272691 [Helianthus annuus]